MYDESMVEVWRKYGLSMAKSMVKVWRKYGKDMAQFAILWPIWRNPYSGFLTLASSTRG